jgi:hypothetical protein
VNHGVGSFRETLVVRVVQTEPHVGQISAKNRDARGQRLGKGVALHVQLKRAPELAGRIGRILRAHQHVEPLGIPTIGALKQARRDMAADVAGRASQEECHVALETGPDPAEPGPAGIGADGSATASGVSPNRNTRRGVGSGARPSISG